MLKNSFRKLMGGLILLVFGLAVYRYIQQTRGSEHVLDALLWGSTFLLFLGLVVWAAYRFDRRMNRRSP